MNWEPLRLRARPAAVTPQASASRGLRIAGEAAGSNPARVLVATAVLMLLLSLVRVRSLGGSNKAPHTQEVTTMDKLKDFAVKLRPAILETSWAVGASTLPTVVHLRS